MPSVIKFAPIISEPPETNACSFSASKVPKGMWRKALNFHLCNKFKKKKKKSFYSRFIFLASLSGSSLKIVSWLSITNEA